PRLARHAARGRARQGSLDGRQARQGSPGARRVEGAQVTAWRAAPLLLALTACSAPGTATPAPVAPGASAATAPAAAASASAASASSSAAASSAPAKPCIGPEFRQFDFWIGDWDLVVRARSAPTSDQWGEAKGHQHVESILAGCAIAEH